MAEEQEHPNQEEEYAKPNPAINPRNISLGEIAKTVAAQHEKEAVEDNNVSSIDDDGNITPAKEVKAETPVAETTERGLCDSKTYILLNAIDESD